MQHLPLPPKRFVLWDLDNCLSDDGWRICYVDWAQEDPTARYAAYHEKCGFDNPCFTHIGVFNESTERGVVPIFCTGRPEIVRSETESWILNHLGVNVQEAGTLFMRPDGCKMSTATLKGEMVKQIRERWPGCAIVHGFDDHKAVLDVYARHQILTTHLCIHTIDAYNAPQVSATAQQPVATAQQPVATAQQPVATAQQPVATPLEELGPARRESLGPTEKRRPTNAADILAAAAATFRVRNAAYADNFRMVAPIVKILFPGGVPPELVVDDRWHLFELLIVKLTRFARSNLAHSDSIHDAAVYAAMIEACIQEQNK